MSNHEYGYDINRPYVPAPAPRSLLHVTDVERLAKAGVKIDFEQIAAQVTPDPAEERPQYYYNDLTRFFWERWLRANSREDSSFNGHLRPYDIFAQRHNDTIYVMVTPPPASDKPFIIEDAATLYPSDALMAQLALWQQSMGKSK